MLPKIPRFLVSFAAKFEHVMKFCPTGCKQKFGDEASRKTPWKIDS